MLILQCAALPLINHLPHTINGGSIPDPDLLDLLLLGFPDPEPLKIFTDPDLDPPILQNIMLTN
jgi:hypothetical protein